VTLAVTTALPAGAVATFAAPNPTTTTSTNASFSRGLTITTTAATPPGTYPFTVQATRGSDCQGAGNPTTTGTLIVQSATVATTTQVTSSQNPSALGDAVTFTATVSSGSPATAVSTGQVSFKTGGTSCSDGTQVQAAQNVNGSGQVTFTTSSLAIGSHVIRGCYGGAAGFFASEGSVTQQVDNTATDIGIASSVNPSVTGQSVTFTATVTNNSNPVTAGQVAFKTGGTGCSDASQVQAPQTPNGSGQVTYAASFDASDSPITIRACYGGSSSPVLGASETSLVQTVNKAATTTTVTSSVNPSVFSQAVTFQATVSAVSPGAGTPSGTVTFKDGTCAAGTTLGSAALNGSGQASVSTSALNAGSHTIRACYPGDDDFEDSEGSVNQQVNKAQTTTAVVSTANPSVFSQTVTFNATVSRVAPAVATPTGNVTFKNGTCAAGTTLGTDALDGSGHASFSTSSLAVGTHPITACYLGTANFEVSDGDVSQVVNKAQTSTAVTSTVNPSVFSQSVTFNVTVDAVLPAVATPQGSVTIKDGNCVAGSALSGSIALNGSGQATFSTSTLSVGSHPITACYTGNPSFEPSDGSVPQTVDKASTTTVVISSVNPSILAQPVTFSVTVSADLPAVAIPQGDVTLKDGTCSGATLDGPTALNGSGQASFTVSSLSAGNHTVTACYAGNASFLASDGSVTQQVKFNFIGFAAPVDRPNTFNVSKAGQAIPLKWELRDFFGNPVTTLTNVTVKVADQSCTQGSTTDQLEEYASGQSGLQNFGDGHYQFNWKTPASYASSCKTIGLDLGEGSVRTNLAFFTFKK
jgi:hypothetical protein